ncbi:MAG: hypothetical protein LBI94_10130, partial [Treponema sp.]|nr:hypothetical protein [Treponema sp.]
MWNLPPLSSIRSGGKLPVGKDFKKGKKQVEMIQVFRDKPVLPPRWDWQKEVSDKAGAKFTADYIQDHYISKAIKGLLPEKKPWPKK